jgi:predicted transcriptional regulator of viral defense system
MEVRGRAPDGYGNPQGLRLLEDLADAGHRVFRSGDAHEAGRRRGLDPARANLLLSLLERAGFVRRLKRGLYAATGRIGGGRPPHDFAIATAMFTPSAISHASALNFHHLSEQVPAAVTCMTTKKIMTPAMRGKTELAGGSRTWVVGDLRILFYSMRPSKFIGIEQVWVDDQSRVPVTDRERTVLEMFLSPWLFGGLSEAVATLEAHRAQLDLEKLARYAVDVEVAVTAKRVGWALETGAAPRAAIRKLRDVPMTGVRRLDPSRPARGPLLPGWGLRDNFTSR